MTPAQHHGFTDLEIAEHLKVVEDLFWSRRRPPISLRDKVREGRRFIGHTLELFIVRPVFNRPSEHNEESIARIRYLPGMRCWRLFWKRSNGQWYRYKPCFEVGSLAEALRVVDEDADSCFFG